jgi:hypothetical protein
VALDREIEQQGQPALLFGFGSRGRQQPAQVDHRGRLEQLGVPRIDRLDLVGVLEPGVVAIELAREFRHELLG